MLNEVSDYLMTLLIGKSKKPSETTVAYIKLVMGKKKVIESSLLPFRL